MDSPLVENQVRALRIALENGTLTREVYAKNILRLKGLAENPAAERIADAFVEGRVDPDLLERNLAALRLPPEPEPDPIDMPPVR